MYSKEKGSVTTQLETDLTHAWGGTQNLNFDISRFFNVSLCKIAANSASLLKIVTYA